MNHTWHFTLAKVMVLYGSGFILGAALTFMIMRPTGDSIVTSLLVATAQVFLVIGLLRRSRTPSNTGRGRSE